MKWVKCSEHLPEDDKYVLAFAKEACAIHINWYSSFSQQWMVGTLKKVTHWCDLPDFPKDEDEGDAPNNVA